MPVAAVQRQHRVKLALELSPTTTVPSPFMPNPLLLNAPGRKPRPTKPVDAVQRAAWVSEAKLPAMTEPSAFTAAAAPAPMLTIPVDAVQRKARLVSDPP